MLRGIYSAAAGMTTQMLLNDVVADNLANLNTPGYKQSGAQFQSFGEVLMGQVSDAGKNSLGTLAMGSDLMGTAINYQQGDLVQTGNPLDLGLRGDGFFVVKDAATNTSYYTRAGNFTMDSAGYITTNQGQRLQGMKGDIMVPLKTKDIVISNDGTVTADGKALDKVMLASFNNNQGLSRLGSTLYSSTEKPSLNSQTVSIEQGTIERSNANIITQMVNSMTGMRVYEGLQRGIQMQDETLQKSVNDVGRLS